MRGREGGLELQAFRQVLEEMDGDGGRERRGGVALEALEETREVHVGGADDSVGVCRELLRDDAACRGDLGDHEVPMLRRETHQHKVKRAQKGVGQRGGEVRRGSGGLEPLGAGNAGR